MRSVLRFALCVFAGTASGQILPDTLTVTSATPPPYQANLTVQTSGTVTVNGAGTTTYTGGGQVILNPGFTAVATSGTTPTFVTQIAPPPFYPNSGSGGSHNFTVSATDPSGSANITNIQVIYNWQPSGVDGCLLHYDVVNDALSIGDLTGSMSTFGSMSLLSPSGTLGDLVNSNCQVLGSGSHVTKTATTVSLFLGIFFRPSQGSGDPATGGVPGFIGPQNIYMLTTTADQQQPGSYQLMGNWTPFPVPQPGTYSSTIAPNTMNPDGTVTMQFYNPNGFNYQPYGEMVFGASYTDPNACRIRYDRGSGAGNHVLSVYGTDFTAPALQGLAPVGAPGVRVAGASCIVDIGHSYVVQESGTGAIVNVMLTLNNTGVIPTYAQGFDRQNVSGVLQQSNVNIPSAHFSLPPVDPVTVVQGSAPVAFTLNIPVTGTFASPVTATVVAPPGVTVALQQNPVNTASAQSTTVQVTALPTALVANSLITITATGGGLASVVNVPITVMPANNGPSPTFGMTGPVQISSAQSATFTVALTPLNGFPANGVVNLSVDPWTDYKVTATLSAASSQVPGSFTVAVAMAPGQTAVYGSTYCALIDGTWGTVTQQVELCINGLGGSNTGFAVPASSQVITVPSGLTSTVYGSANSTSLNLSQSVSCAVGASCDASAAFGVISGGTIPITLSAGSLLAGTTYTQTVSANGQSQSMPVTVTPGIIPVPNAWPVSDDGTPASVVFTGCGQFCQILTLCGASVPGITTQITSQTGTSLSLTFRADQSAAGDVSTISCSLLGYGRVKIGKVAVSGGCTTPSITGVQVNGQLTNTVIAGTSGYFSLFGQCLAGAQSPQVDGSGINISSYTLTSLGGTRYQINAFFQSSTTTSGGTHNVTVSNGQGSASAQVFSTTVSVNTVTFGPENNNFVILKDSFASIPPAAQPIWLPVNSSDANDPVGYVQGSQMSGTISFNLVPSPPNPIIGVRVEGAASGYGTLIGANITLQPVNPGSTKSAAVPFSTSALLPATTKFFNPMSVTWSLSGDGSPCSSNCTGIGSTAGRVYVTLGLPTVSPVLETFVHLAASISGAATPPQAFRNTWSLFEGPANVKTWDGLPLFYYQHGQGFNACAKFPDQLLVSGTGSGQCGSFALLFEAALAMNGIQVDFPGRPNPSAKVSWVQINALDRSSVNPTIMLVKNWGFSKPPAYPSQPYPWSFALNNGDYMVPPLSDYRNLSYQTGAPGQGPTDPSEKAFDFHFIVKADPSLLTGGPSIGPYFDPSYGKWYATPSDFESNALAGYAILDSNFLQLPTVATWLYVVKPALGANNIYFSK